MTEQTFAASTNGSLIMLTVNSLVPRMFSRLSFGLPGERLKDTLRRGGLCEIYNIEGFDQCM